LVQKIQIPNLFKLFVNLFCVKLCFVLANKSFGGALSKSNQNKAVLGPPRNMAGFF